MTSPFHPSRRRFLAGCGAALAALSSRRLHAAEPAQQVPAIDERIRRLASDAPLSLEFRGSSADDCRRWQATFAAKLRSLLGPHQQPARWQTTVERTVELKDHRREELVLTAEDHPPLPLYLLVPHGLVPHGSAARRAGVLAIHGHSAGNFGY